MQIKSNLKNRTIWGLKIVFSGAVVAVVAA